MSRARGIEELQSVNCSACSGTGMGHGVEWAACRVCRGAGVVLDVDLDDARDAYEERLAEARESREMGFDL